MKENNIIIRPATPEDSSEILAIYGPYIENTAITFEYTIPSEEDFRQRVKNILSKFPYLVAANKTDGKIVGYAYANTFRTRKAYDHTIELSIYLLPEARGNGTGRRLYAALEQILIQQNVLTMIACITSASGTDPEDGTNESVCFHTAVGFTMCGSLLKSGFKFGNWYDTVYMEKFLGSHTSSPADVIPFFDICAQINFDSL